MARSLNKVILIGNLTRDPELRYTPQGTAVASFSIATNRQWRTESGENRDEVEFHRIVAWAKLAEICGQYLKKGGKVYVDGRIQSKKWQTKEGEDRTTYEIVINEMMMLDSKGSPSSYSGPEDPGAEVPDDLGESTKKETKKEEPKKKASKKKTEQEEDDDIPF